MLCSCCMHDRDLHFSEGCQALETADGAYRPCPCPAYSDRPLRGPSWWDRFWARFWRFIGWDL